MYVLRKKLLKPLHINFKYGTLGWNGLETVKLHLLLPIKLEFSNDRANYVIISSGAQKSKFSLFKRKLRHG